MNAFPKLKYTARSSFRRYRPVGHLRSWCKSHLCDTVAPDFVGLEINDGRGFKLRVNQVVEQRSKKQNGAQNNPMPILRHLIFNNGSTSNQWASVSFLE
jgi:hypothetical protein